MRLSATSLASIRPRSALTLTQQAINILRRPGLESHAFIPGVGWVNGLSLTNSIMEDGTQAASVDNPMGYMGDAASTTLGAELLRYVSVGSNWTDNADGSFTKTAASWGGVGGYGAISPVGKTYRISWRVVSISAGSTLSVYRRNLANTSAEAVGSPITVVAGGTYSAEVTCVSSYATSNVWIDSNTFVGIIDNISVRELVGAIPARQATTANKPILRRGHVNRIRNSTMVGAVVGTPGTLPTNWNGGLPAGISRSVVDIGTIGDLTYIDVRFFGTASASGGIVLDPEALYSTNPAVVGQTWTFSSSLALMAGSWPVRTVGIEIFERNSSNTLLASFQQDIRSAVTGTTLTTVSTTRALNQATVAGVTCGAVRCSLLSGDVVDFTIRIAAPQLGQGSVANTFVPTTTAAASSPTGPYWLEFDGTDFLSLAAVPFQQADDHVVIAGVEATSYNNNFVFAIRSSAATNPIVAGMRIEASTGLLQGLWRDDAGTLVTPSVAGAVGLGAKFIGSMRFTGGTRQIRRNAGAWTSSGAALGATTVNTATIGAAVTTTTTGLVSGAIYSVIAIKGTVTDAELATLERFVAQASGVTL